MKHECTGAYDMHSYKAGAKQKGEKNIYKHKNSYSNGNCLVMLHMTITPFCLSYNNNTNNHGNDMNNVTYNHITSNKDSGSGTIIKLIEVIINMIITKLRILMIITIKGVTIQMIVKTITD